MSAHVYGNHVRPKIRENRELKKGKFEKSGESSETVVNGWFYGLAFGESLIPWCRRWWWEGHISWTCVGSAVWAAHSQQAELFRNSPKVSCWGCPKEQLMMVMASMRQDGSRCGPYLARCRGVWAVLGIWAWCHSCGSLTCSQNNKQKLAELTINFFAFHSHINGNFAQQFACALIV